MGLLLQNKIECTCCDYNKKKACRDGRSPSNFSPKDDTIIISEAAVEVWNKVLNNFYDTLRPGHHVLQKLCHHKLPYSDIFNTFIYGNTAILN